MCVLIPKQTTHCKLMTGKPLQTENEERLDVVLISLQVCLFHVHTPGFFPLSVTFLHQATRGLFLLKIHGVLEPSLVLSLSLSVLHTRAMGGGRASGLSAHDMTTVKAELRHLSL